jgi:LuxR family transcriptional regulator, maltose regulon positive regulatory protein
VRSAVAAPGWLSLDSSDNDPALFWAGFVRALQAGRAPMGNSTLRALLAGSAPTIQSLTGLINEITGADTDFLLVIDDYHVIESPEVHTALAFFLDHMPPRMHVALGSPADPLLPIARMRARGEVLELRAGDLRFTPDEASDFLRSMTGLGLQQSDVAALEQRTEGWVAGLKLAALHMQGLDDVRGFIDAFSGDHRSDANVTATITCLPRCCRRRPFARSRIVSVICTDVPVPGMRRTARMPMQPPRPELSFDAEP